jgi:hypothetical protein
LDGVVAAACTRDIEDSGRTGAGDRRLYQIAFQSATVISLGAGRRCKDESNGDCCAGSRFISSFFLLLNRSLSTTGTPDTLLATTGAATAIATGDATAKLLA